MYKIARKLHLWLAVPFGVVIFIVCLTGFILLFQPEYQPGSQRPEFFLEVMRLHRWLFDAPAAKGMMTTGKMIVAVSVCAFVVILLTGFILWWQRARLGLAKSLKIVGNKGLSLLSDTAHVALGAYSVLFLLTMALTGLTWSFGWWRSLFYSLFGIEKGSHIVVAIHTGSFGGICTQILWGLSALAGVILVITGYYIWLRRLSLKKSKK